MSTNNSELSIWERIQNGEFKNEVPFVSLKTFVPTSEWQTYQEARDKYNAGERDAVFNFHLALSEEYGLTGHPKEATLFKIAWAQGHAYGLEEVYNHYDELSELLQ